MRPMVFHVSELADRFEQVVVLSSSMVKEVSLIKD